MSEPSRWDHEDQQAQEPASSWFDRYNRLPWWVFAVLALAAVTRALYLLTAGERSWQNLLDALLLLVLLAPALADAARRRHRGEPALRKTPGR